MTVDKNIENERLQENFNWRKVDVSIILANPKYQDLFDRHDKRNTLINKSVGLSNEEQALLRSTVRSEEELDEKDQLKTERERQEYLHWFVKFKNLEVVKDDIDPGMYPLLYKFNRLPFSSHSSDTGHILEGTNRLEEDWLPVLTFLAYKDLSEEELRVQIEFLRGITTLNINICNRLGVEPYNLLDLKGYLVELENGEMKELSIQETLNDELELTLYLNVPDNSLKNERGDEVLTAVWQEFSDYLNSFLGGEESAPDFDEGRLFVRKN